MLLMSSGQEGQVGAAGSGTIRVHNRLVELLLIWWRCLIGGLRVDDAKGDDSIAIE